MEPGVRKNRISHIKYSTLFRFVYLSGPNHHSIPTMLLCIYIDFFSRSCLNVATVYHLVKCSLKIHYTAYLYRHARKLLREEYRIMCFTGVLIFHTVMKHSYLLDTLFLIFFVKFWLIRSNYYVQ